MRRSFLIFLTSLGLYSLGLSGVYARTTNTTTTSTIPVIAITSSTSSVTPWHPDKINVDALETYWLDRVNALRNAKHLPSLTLDPRFNETATEWSTYTGRTGRATHVRANGFSMHQWIATKKLPFTKRYSSGGWKTNYFSENIAWGYTDNSLASAESALNDALHFMLAEATYNGPHYRTIYHADWNALGAGFYFKPVGKGRYQLFSTFHYGSLQPLTSTTRSP